MLDRYKNVSVIGLGYIGLPTASLLAKTGYMVNGMDIDHHAIEIINEGKAHIVEPDLEGYVNSAVSAGKLRADSIVKPADVYIICVPTPFHSDSLDPTPNVEYVRAAAKSISPLVKEGDIVILESTSPVGTTDMVQAVLKEGGVNTADIFIAYCPERVLPGKIMTELVENARVIGGITPQSTLVVASFYKTFVSGEILETDAKTAEMCKLTENSYRDVNIAFANELSIVCDNNGVNVWDLIKLANHHPRVDVLQPGTGVGGHCIAVDPWFIVAADPANTRLIKTSRLVNDSKPEWVIDKIKAEADLKNTKRIVCLGLAFKPDIDDLRESPAVKVVDSLIRQKYEVSVVEPNIAFHRDYNLSAIRDAVSEFDVIAVLVAHKEFSEKETLKKLEVKRALDFCGLFCS